MSECDVLGIGSVVIDHQVVLDRYPEENSKTRIMDSRSQVGGPVPTALVQLSRFGRSCAFMGSWADDPQGRMIQEDLTEQRIDFQHACQTAPHPTGFAHVWISTEHATRTIVNTRGDDDKHHGRTNGTPSLGLSDRGLPYRCQALHVDGMFPDVALAAAAVVKDRGGLVFLDTGNPKPGTSPLLPHVDVAVCPAHFMRSFLDADEQCGAEMLLDRGAGHVIVTRGEHGATLYSSDQRHHEPACEVDALDTTGAGDIFCGGLIHGVLLGWDWPTCMRFASTAAALKCRTLGNRDALPRLEDVLDKCGVA